MGRLQRMYAESGMYFVTTRAFQARMLLTPSPELNDVVGGVLAKAVERTGVQLHGFVVASNHLHLLVTARGASLSDFMKYFLGNTSRKVGPLVDWTGSLWQRRFKAEPVLDDAAAVGRLRYILAHGVKEGLVRHPSEWPGLSCLRLLREGGEARFRFFHWAERWKKGVLREGGEDLWADRWAEPVALRLTPIPCWAGLSAQAAAAAVDDLVAGIVQEGAEARPNVLGQRAVVTMNPHHRPARAKKGPGPVCHASSSAARWAFRDTLRAWCAAFAAASARFRRGEWAVEFPPWAFRPGVRYQVCVT